LEGMSKNEPRILSFLSRLADLVLLNLLTLLCCIPVLTAGASICACHYSARKIIKDELHVATSFWRAFRDNLIRAGILFLIFALVIGASAATYIFAPAFFAGSMLAMVRGFEVFVIIAAVMIALWAFPLQANFVYSIKYIFYNSAVLAIRYFPRTIGMLLLWALPVVMVLSFRFAWMLAAFFIGLSVPAYFSAKLYRPVFEDIEEMINSKNEQERK